MESSILYILYALRTFEQGDFKSLMESIPLKPIFFPCNTN